MSYPFTVFQMENEGHIFWVAKSIQLKGCVGQGDTQEEAINQLEENEAAWLETAKQMDIPIPEVTIERASDYSGKMTLRIAAYVHKQAAMYAKREGVSLNQYINDAIVTQNALMSIKMAAVS